MLREGRLLHKGHFQFVCRTIPFFSHTRLSLSRCRSNTLTCFQHTNLNQFLEEKRTLEETAWKVTSMILVYSFYAVFFLFFLAAVMRRKRMLVNKKYLNLPFFNISWGLGGTYSAGKCKDKTGYMMTFFFFFWGTQKTEHIQFMQVGHWAKYKKNLRNPNHSSAKNKTPLPRCWSKQHRDVLEAMYSCFVKPVVCGQKSFAVNFTLFLKACNHD